MKTKDIIENNDLPIYCYVNGEVVGEAESSCYWLGKVTNAKVTEIAEVSEYGPYNQTIVEKSDIDYYEECLIDKLCDEVPVEVPEEDFEEIVKAKINELEFKKVILLYVDTI